MSYTELHTGKLKIMHKDVSIDDFKAWLKIIEKDGFEVEDFEEKLEDEYEFFEVTDKSKKYKESMYVKYIYNKGTLYEMIEHSGEQEADFIDITTKNSDGTINFTYLFYNGGTCFSEMLEEGLEKLIKANNTY